MKNNNNKLYREWVKKAENDLAAAEILFREKGPTDSLCFHCQQAIEKYLKAFLTFHKIHFEKIHSLWVLAKLCANKDKEFLNFRERLKLKILDAYYIEARYPPEVTVYSRKECAEALKITKEVIRFIESKI